MQHRRPRRNRHFKIDHVLSPPDREAYLAFLREPPTTVDIAHAWLKEHGYTTVSRSAVARHKRLLLERDEEHDRTLRTAAAYARLAGSPGAPDLAAGAMLRAEHLVFERVWDFKAEKDLDDELAKPAEVQEVLEMIAALIRTRRQFEEFKKAFVRSIEPGEAAQPAWGEQAQKEQECLRRMHEILGYEPREPEPKPPAAATDGSDPSEN